MIKEKKLSKKEEIGGLYIDVKMSFFATALFLGISLGLVISKILNVSIILGSILYFIASIILILSHLKFNKKFKEEMKLDGGKKRKRKC